MSRSSPGRYALHEFAKNVFDVHAFDGKGKELTPTRPESVSVGRRRPRRHRPHRLQGLRRSRRRHLSRRRHDARAHEHAGDADVGARPRRRGRSASRSSRRPARPWKSATQLFPTDDPLDVHRAEPPVPDGQPDRAQRAHAAHVHGAATPTARSSPIRTAVHHDGTDADDRRVRRAASRRSSARAARSSASSREFDTGTYTFLGDYVPWGGGDGMEHRNSTVVASPASFKNPQAARRAARHRRRTSSSTPGTSSASVRRRSSRSTSKRPTCPASCGSPKASRSTTAR